MRCSGFLWKRCRELVPSPGGDRVPPLLHVRSRTSAAAGSHGMILGFSSSRWCWEGMLGPWDVLRGHASTASMGEVQRDPSWGWSMQARLRHGSVLCNTRDGQSERLTIKEVYLIISKQLIKNLRKRAVPYPPLLCHPCKNPCQAAAADARAGRDRRCCCQKLFWCHPHVSLKCL